ncbi:MAG: thimet oligopeptidase, partial [Patescibacteria group bacterium]|nr:thimet oligopeptidase [Patescibacteria group bacterium]
VRKASRDFQETLSKKSIDISFDEALYGAFKEYNPKKEKLSDPEKMLYKWTKIGFENQGFHLPQKKQEELKKIKKELSDLSMSFSKNIDEYHDFILCTKDELSGLPDSYIANLKTDKKTKKYIISLSYPELRPFLRFANNEVKRKELADKSSQKGGKDNIKILSKILRLRKKLAEIMGHDSFVTLVTKNKIAKNGENVKKFLESTISKLKPIMSKDYKKLQDYIDKKFPSKKLNYYNTAYFSTKMKEDLYSYDQNKVKEYFELNDVMEKMFKIFGGLFSVSFVENNTLPTWHKDVKLFDVVEKSVVIGHIALDLYPRKNKFSHMACWNLIPGRNKSFRSSEYLAPVSVIVGNFPLGSKENPSLLSVGEIETLFHEFGHMSHDYLSRAPFASQAGTNVVFDFVETPSQLFENWVRDRKNLKDISKHYKTGEQISEELLSKVISSLDFMKASNFYHTFVMSLQDYEMHTDKWNIDPIKLDKEFNKRYGFFDLSPKSLFPASWGHMAGYEAKYYSYMWSIVYSYDLFSLFKEKGIMNKKIGMELRRKILEKGGSEDELKQIESFLGRKPNNKAFLEALGIKK